MAEYLFATSYTDKKVLQFTGFSATINSSFTRSNNVTGGAWSGGAQDTTTGNIIWWEGTANSMKMGTGFSSTVSSSFAYSSFAYDLHHDGTDLYIQLSGAKMRKMSGFSSTVASSFSDTGELIRGMALSPAGDTYVSSISPSTRLIKYTGFSSTVADSAAVTNLTQGTGHDGTNVLGGRHTSRRYCKFSGFSSTVTSSFAAPDSGGEADGMMWVADVAGATFTPKAIMF